MGLIDTDKALTPISQAQRMLAEAKTLPELKNLRDYATGAKAWAKARGMGIGAENEAAEVILRAERGIGHILSEVSRSPGGIPDQLSFATGQLTPYQQALMDVGLAREGEARGLRPGGPALDWQRLARLPDDLFERMLSAAHVEGARLAKFNFYNAIKRAEEGPRQPPSAMWTPEDPGFGMFRAGVYNLLGWEVDETGAGAPTKNDLMYLPNDELMQVAALVKALVTAYNEAKAARG